MRRLAVPIVLAPVILAGCAAHHDNSAPETLAALRKVQPDLQEAKVDKSLEQALEGYRRFLQETPKTQMTPEAMRRLADLEVEKQFGIHTDDGKPKEMAAPQAAQVPVESRPEAQAPAGAVADGDQPESDEEFEKRTTAEGGALKTDDSGTPQDGPVLPEGEAKGPLDAIALYEKLLKEYPEYEHNDQVLYQMARAYDELGRTEDAMKTMERLIQENPDSVHYDEVQFRRGEFFFTRRHYRDAESAYGAIVGMGPASSYYELALYKLGWTLYKQEFYEEALHKYMALLDYKVSIGYDFDQEHDEEDERRVTDTYRVISLSFTNLGGADAVQEYFSSFGHRAYENRVYNNLGEHYLAKLRYDDAAKTYEAFEKLYPFHRAAPEFGMHLVETYTKGGFPKLVLQSRREFASKYGLKSEYWHHFKPEDRPEVLDYLKTDLKDLATHYHAEYQSAEDDGEKQTDYSEALRWYGDFLDSFPADSETPAINYRLADLLLENKDFGEAAKQYERTAYSYPAHEKSADAGYAAVYAYREQLKAATDEQRDAVRQDVVASSIKFADTFPDNEHAATILGAAADDLYEMKNYPDAAATAQRVIDTYPAAETGIRRSAWLVVAHSSFELADYARAEQGYTQVLAVTPEDDETRAGLVDNLAASIYKQGELARDAKDYRAAADNFLRIRTVAPTSAIRPTAEYDAGAALIELKAWTEAVDVLQAFRSAYPDDKMHVEATRQIAYAYRQEADLPHAAEEYDRLATESEDPAIRSEALLVAGDLYHQTKALDKAIDAYTRYVDDFPKPVEAAVETRFKIAQIQKESENDILYYYELGEIVRIDAEAGPERTDRTRTLAARSALALAQLDFQEFVAVKLTQPFEASLQEKQQRMNATIEAMDHLVDYEIGEITAAATYYMAETYLDFSRSLKDSERPADLEPADKDAYEDALDEQAYPFEEKAINFHEKNVELLHTGVFDEWTQKSLAELAELVPGRYAKNELSADFLDAVDSYVYRLPGHEGSGTAIKQAESTDKGQPAGTAPAAPVSMDQGTESHERPR
ncbi:MAG TPA: tetratricopeptide repeat protein [Candidatus Saccharimonadales bacterium]|nr:tetratricopeptide repeat protein [Candidatus Saccharimonadales bacterium]